MNPFLELQKLLVDKKVVLSGTVVQVASSQLQVRTALGVITASLTDSTDYKVGDSVLVDSGVVKGRLKSVDSVPVYHI